MNWPVWLSLGGHTSDHCRPFWLWVGITALMVPIVAFYFAIARDARRREREAGVRLTAMEWQFRVFVLCGATRLFDVVSYWVPAYSLYLLALLLLLVESARMYRRRHTYDIVFRNTSAAETLERIRMAFCPSDSTCGDHSSDPALARTRLEAIGQELDAHLTRIRKRTK